MPRDVDLLATVALFRRLTGVQVMSLLPFGSRQTTGYRLQLLWQHGYLERDYWKVAFGGSPAIYRVGAKGARTLAARLGGDAEKYVSTRSASDQLFLEHTLAVNDVLIAFILAARRAGHHVEWEFPAEPLDRLADPLKTNAIIPVFPDASLEYQVQTQKRRFFLEVDRGTEPGRRFAEKIRGYLSYLTSGDYERRFGLRAFRILVVAPGAKRLRTLQLAVSETINQMLPHVALSVAAMQWIVWYAEQDHVRLDTVLSDVWTANGQPAAFLPKDTSQTRD